MNDNSNVFPLRQPGNIDDPLTDILQSGARRLLAQAIELEAETFLEAMKDLKLADGRDRLVRSRSWSWTHHSNRDRSGRGVAREDSGSRGGERIGFTSAILPLWARRTRSLDSLLPVLYLRGISTGDFQEAMAALLGTDASNLSPAVISRLTAEWKEEYTRWQKRDLSARHYAYAWADGVYLQARMEEHSDCIAPEEPGWISLTFELWTGETTMQSAP
jgi:putative transposase